MDLQVYGMRNVMELATTLIAVDTLSGGKATVNHGNVAHLVGADASMNSAASINTPEAKASGYDRGLIERCFAQHDYCASIAPDQHDVLFDLARFRKV